ncbi:tetratricopeptide repeat protein [Bradyrhizobium monzae]|uniref:tetratricopeptide repeat protein n=1 Tax=Bradyrhizobium sp. Oc8 TaxID=2876780 RepID=UPI001F1A0139
MRAQLEQIFSSQHFQANERRRGFLRFIVEETLSGRAQSLKGYTIALAVFGRDDSFDPQADPVVRLEARRLRRDLDSYYVDAGRNDPVRIVIPKGSYVPNFEWLNKPSIAGSADESALELPAVSDRNGAVDVSPITRSSSYRRWSIGAALVAAVAAGLIMWMSPFGAGRFPLSTTREPGVLVMPFEPLSSGENTRYLAAGMGQELTANLFHFSGFRLYTSSSLPDQASRSLQLARDRGFSYVVNGSVQTDAEEVRVTISVVNATSGGIVWTKSYSRPLDPQSFVSTQRALADEIAEVIGQPYGVVRTDMSNGSTAPAVSHMDSYVCVLRAYGYRRTFLRAEFDPAMRCLEQTVQRDPGYSDAWAMLGWLHLDAGRLGFAGDDRQSRYDKAQDAISKALSLQPKNPLALKALAAAYHFTGRYEESQRLTRQLVDLNPNDPEILAQLGWRLSVRGNFEEGVPTLQRAIDRTLNPPNWYFHFIAVGLYLKGDWEQARRIAEQSARGDSGFSQLVLATAYAELGDRQGTQQALVKLGRYEPLARDTEGFLRRQGIADQTVTALVAGLEKARALASR